MKLILLLSLIFLLSGCSSREELILPSARIVRFLKGDTAIGYGVKMNWENILTATHVVEDCKKWNCTFSWEHLSDFDIASRWDISSIAKTKPALNTKLEVIGKGSPVYILRFISWVFHRFDTVVTDINVDYIWYDETFSWVYLTWWIEIGMALQKGESGLPVWTLSWELVGVVSATNERTGKSYIVQ